MPGQDGTGPQGQGPRTGRGRGMAQSGQRSEELGKCKCLECGETIPRVGGVSCASTNCPKRGTSMSEDSY